MIRTFEWRPLGTLHCLGAHSRKLVYIVSRFRPYLTEVPIQAAEKAVVSGVWPALRGGGVVSQRPVVQPVSSSIDTMVTASMGGSADSLMCAVPVGDHTQSRSAKWMATSRRKQLTRLPSVLVVEYCIHFHNVLSLSNVSDRGGSNDSGGTYIGRVYMV